MQLHQKIKALFNLSKTSTLGSVKNYFCITAPQLQTSLLFEINNNLLFFNVKTNFYFNELRLSKVIFITFKWSIKSLCNVRFISTALDA